jgi:hypothetical protein
MKKLVVFASMMALVGALGASALSYVSAPLFGTRLR